MTMMIGSGRRMDLRRRAAFGALAAIATCAVVAPRTAVAADAPQAQLVVTYVEPPVSDAAAVERTLVAYAERTRRAQGAPQVEVLREIGRPERLAVVERWPAGATPDEGGLQKELEGKVQAPIDRRVHRALGALLAPAPAAPFHMLMHVDVVPAGAEMAAKALDAHRSAVAGAEGGRGYEAAVQTDRANHFAVHHTWSSRAAYGAYTAGKAARDLRAQLATAKGGLYDDRFYTQVAPARAR